MPSYQFDKFLGVTMKSQAKPLSGQKNRSSDNYDLRRMKRCSSIRWSCPDGISFNVMEDKSAATDPVTFRDIRNGTVTPFPSDSACNGLYIANPKGASGEFRVSVRSSVRYTPPQSWMSEISNDRNITDLCIPGTHDSGATWGISPTGRCQTLSIFDQLNVKGVRFLDIRCAIESDRLRICHGPISQNLWLEEVLNQCIEFLKLNPRESVIISIKKERSGDDENIFEELFYTKYYSKSPFAGIWYGANSIPTLGSVRGKIVLFRRFANQNKSYAAQGIDASPGNWKDNTEFEIVRTDKNIRIQDVYHVGSPEEKFAKVKKFIEESSASKWCINFASAYCTLIPDVSTVSNFVNVKLDDLLTTTKFKGVILMDYIDQDSSGDCLTVSKKIISMN